MSEPFDIEAARTYAGRRLQSGDSYHAADLLAACDEIERLVAALRYIVGLADHATEHFNDLGMSDVAREALREADTGKESQ